MLRIALALVSVLATGCFSFSQFDQEEEARNRREWVLERDHILDPVAYHAQELPVEGLDPEGPRPLFGPRRDPDTQPRARPPREHDMHRTLDAWELYEKQRELEER